MFKYLSTLSVGEFQQKSIVLFAENKASQSVKRKRTPGRPAKAISVNSVLNSDSTNSNNNNNNNDKGNNNDEKPEKKTRVDWFKSPYIDDILEAYKWNKSGYSTVNYLRKRYPSSKFRGRYDNLAESTVDGWFDDKHQLLPKYAEKLEETYEPNKQLNNRIAILDQHVDLKSTIIGQLQSIRDAGTAMKIRNIRIIMQAMIKHFKPDLLEQLKFSKSFICKFVRNNLQWTTRRRTTAASKLPADWEAQGRAMIERIAVLVKQYNIPRNLIINFDQTGVHLVPQSNTTYEKKGAKDVPVFGADDKRQITAVVSSTPAGNFLPLQLIFQGKTVDCEPDPTKESIRNKFHLTHSENHWSNQETMKQFIQHIIHPYILSVIEKQNLKEEQKAILLLDCWSVHKSKEFREFIRKYYDNILLVFIPPNCTSKLQVADVALNYSFKHGIKYRYDEWAGLEIYKQLVAKRNQLKLETGMLIIKPLLLNWATESWRLLENRGDLIMKGWFKCMDSILDPFNTEVQNKAMTKMIQGQLEAYGFVPDLNEPDPDNAYWEGESSDSGSEDELDILKRRIEGTRKSNRNKTETKPAFGNATIRTDQIESDSDVEMFV
jgi:hypothetical protein